MKTEFDFRSPINDKFYKNIENKVANKSKVKANFTAEQEKNLLNKQNELLRLASGGDRKFGHEGLKARNQVFQALTDEVTLAIPAQTMFGQFFEMGTFTPDRRTWYYSIEENNIDAGTEMQIHRIDRNGNAPKVETITDETFVTIHPYQITSDRYYMDKMALQLGIIAEPTRNKQLAAENLAWKMENDFEALLTEGLYSNIYDINGIDISSKIAKVPESNDLDLSDYDGVTLSMFKDIAIYAKRMGLQIETIYASVSTETDMWDWLDVPAQYDGQEGNAPAELIPTILREKLVTEGVPGQLFGRNFNIQSINTLNDDPTEGDVYMWIKFSGGCGHVKFLEGGYFEDTFTKEDANRIYYNIMKTLMMFQTPKQRVNYARVKIKDEV